MKKDLRCQKKMKAMKISSIAQININKQQHSIIHINYHLKLCYDMHEARELLTRRFRANLPNFRLNLLASR